MSCIHCVHSPSDLSELLWIQKAYVKMEQEEYSKETIDWGNIEFIDNQIALDLTEKVAEAKSLLLGCLRTSPSMNLPSCCLTGFLLAHHATLRLWLRRLQRRRL